MSEIGLRSGKVGLGRYEYRHGEFTITRMGNGQWYVWRGDKDTGEDFRTLREARNWCRHQPQTAA